MEGSKKPISERFYEECDLNTLPFTLILKWKDGSLFMREEVEQLYRSGYIYRTVYDATMAEIDRINDMYDSR